MNCCTIERLCAPVHCGKWIWRQKCKMAMNEDCNYRGVIRNIYFILILVLNEMHILYIYIWILHTYESWGIHYFSLWLNCDAVEPHNNIVCERLQNSSRLSIIILNERWVACVFSCVCSSARAIVQFVCVTWDKWPLLMRCTHILHRV